nr:hypothetical protein [Tanacetum cinerariifolium]
MKKIIKEQVKTHVKAQVTRILPRIEESVNAQLEAEVLTRSSHSSRTSYAVTADLSEMELKKILIEKMEGNKREDDDQNGPFAGSDRGSKRRREGGEHASASTPSEPATGSTGRSTTGTQSRQLSASESAFAEEPVQTTCQMKEPSHPVFQTVYKATTDQLDWVNPEGQQYPHNLLQPLPLIPDNWGRQDVYKEYRHSAACERSSTGSRREAYTAYSNPRGFIYQNKDKKNRLMRIDELHKFNDGTLNDFRNALDDRLKGIRMQYLPTTI